MCNLLKAAVACLPRLSKSDHPLSSHRHWASVIDGQLSQLQGGLRKWTSHQIQPTIKYRIPLPLAGPRLFSELFFHLVPQPLCTNMFSEVAVFSTGSFSEVHLPLHSAGRFTSCNLHYSASLNIHRLLLTPVSPICQPEACSPVVYLSVDGWLSCAMPLQWFAHAGWKDGHLV